MSLLRFKEFFLVGLFTAFWFWVFYREARFIVLCLLQRPLASGHFTAITHGLALVGLVCGLYAYFIEPYWLETRQVVITSPLVHDDLTVVQISDLHCDTHIRTEEQIVKAVNAAHPDVVVFTGDTLNSPDGLPLLHRTLAALRAGMGKFAVRGNFDVVAWGGFDLFGNTGFVELDGTTVALTKNQTRFTVSGLSVARDPAGFPIKNKLFDNAYNIFLFHYPGVNEEIKNNPFQLFLGGHVHGGQVALPFYGALITLSKYGKKYEAGRYDVGDKVVYVSRGVGMEGHWVPRLRFCSRPEITVFHIRPAAVSR